MKFWTILAAFKKIGVPYQFLKGSSVEQLFVISMKVVCVSLLRSLSEKIYVDSEVNFLVYFWVYFLDILIVR